LFERMRRCPTLCEQCCPSPPFRKGGLGGFWQGGAEACLRQAKHLAVQCTQTGDRLGGFRPAADRNEDHRVSAVTSFFVCPYTLSSLICSFCSFISPTPSAAAFPIMSIWSATRPIRPAP